MRFLSLKLTDLHVLSYQPASSRSGKTNVKGLKTMVEKGECLMVRLRRGRSWDACMGDKNDYGDSHASLKKDACHFVSMHDHVIAPSLLMPSSNSEDNVHVLHYNVNWMYSAFRSRAITEALLSPEHESGNLTSRDYYAAIQFLPGTHRFYPVRSLPSLWLLLRSHLAPLFSVL